MNFPAGVGFFTSGPGSARVSPSVLKSLGRAPFSDMIACKKCGTENLEGALYCDECGAPLAGALVSAPSARGPRADGDSQNRVESPAQGKATTLGGAVEGLSEALPEFVGSPVGGPRALTNAATPEAEAGRTRREGPHARLVIERGKSAGKEFWLDADETHLGRWDADGGIFPDVDLDADDPEAKVSRRHARILRRGEQYFIEDLGSTNGTFVNRGRRLLPGDRQPLRDGDEVIVGKTFLRFHVITR